MTQPDSDPAATERALSELAAKLEPEEARWLAEHARNASASGDERVLSSFILSRSRSAGALSALGALAGSKLPELDPESPFRNVELAVRALAIEGIARQVGNPAAGELLQELSTDTSDSFLRKRAEQGFKSWKTGKENGLEESDHSRLKGLLSN